MAYSGENIAEHMVPLARETAERVKGFYEDIGWDVLAAENDHLLSAVYDTPNGTVDGIGYWQTATTHKTAWFAEHTNPTDPNNHSCYNIGLRLPRLMDLVERPLVLPTNEDLMTVVEHGGKLLAKHTHIPLREHAGRLEIRFSDPFLFGIRLTGPKNSAQG